MDTNTWDFENEDFLSIAKMKQPLKEGVTFRNQFMMLYMKICWLLFLRMNILLLQNCQEEQVCADFISEGTQKQGSGELVDT